MNRNLNFFLYDEASRPEKFNFEGFSDQFIIEDCHLYPDSFFTPLSVDKSHLRLMGRTARMLLCLAQMKEIRKFLTETKIASEKIGLYGAFYSSEFPYALYRNTLKSNDYAEAINHDLHPFSLIYRSNALTTAHVSQFLSITGPSQTYTHKKWGLVHALEQAKFDLEMKKIEYAIIFSAHSIKDDPFRYSSKEKVNPLLKKECIFFSGFNSLEYTIIEKLKSEVRKKQFYINILGELKL